jgi:hypothetical protein
MRRLSLLSGQKLLHTPQLRIYRCAVRRPACSFAQPPARPFQPSRLAIQHAQQEKRIGVARVQSQHFLVHRSRRRCAARTMMFRRDLHNGCQKLCYRDVGSGKGAGHCNHLNRKFKILPDDTIAIFRLFFTPNLAAEGPLSLNE